MEYYINKNVYLEKIQRIWILLNFENQTTIGLDRRGVLFWEKVKKKELKEDDIKDNKL